MFEQLYESTFCEAIEICVDIEIQNGTVFFRKKVIKTGVFL